jgi:hypothetical protein
MVKFEGVLPTMPNVGFILSGLSEKDNITSNTTSHIGYLTGIKHQNLDAALSLFGRGVIGVPFYWDLNRDQKDEELDYLRVDKNIKLNISLAATARVVVLTGKDRLPHEIKPLIVKEFKDFKNEKCLIIGYKYYTKYPNMDHIAKIEPSFDPIDIHNIGKYERCHFINGEPWSHLHQHFQTLDDEFKKTRYRRLIIGENQPVEVLISEHTFRDITLKTVDEVIEESKELSSTYQSLVVEEGEENPIKKCPFCMEPNIGIDLSSKPDLLKNRCKNCYGVYQCTPNVLSECARELIASVTHSPEFQKKMPIPKDWLENEEEKKNKIAQEMPIINSPKNRWIWNPYYPRFFLFLAKLIAPVLTNIVRDSILTARPSYRKHDTPYFEDPSVPEHYTAALGVRPGASPREEIKIMANEISKANEEGTEPWFKRLPIPHENPDTHSNVFLSNSKYKKYAEANNDDKKWLFYIPTVDYENLMKADGNQALIQMWMKMNKLNRPRHGEAYAKGFRDIIEIQIGHLSKKIKIAEGNEENKEVNYQTDVSSFFFDLNEMIDTFIKVKQTITNAGDQVNREVGDWIHFIEKYCQLLFEERQNGLMAEAYEGKGSDTWESQIRIPLYETMTYALVRRAIYSPQAMEKNLKQQSTRSQYNQFKILSPPIGSILSKNQEPLYIYQRYQPWADEKGDPIPSGDIKLKYPCSAEDILETYSNRFNGVMGILKKGEFAGQDKDIDPCDTNLLWNSWISPQDENRRKNLFEEVQRHRDYYNFLNQRAYAEGPFICCDGEPDDWRESESDEWKQGSDHGEEANVVVLEEMGIPRKKTLKISTDSDEFNINMSPNEEDYIEFNKLFD